MSARAETEAREESALFVVWMLVVFMVALAGVIMPAHRRAAKSIEQSVRSEEQEARIGSEVARHAAERDRREAEAQFQALFRHSSVGVALTDQRGWILETNQALQSMLGYSEAELRGSQFGEVVVSARRFLEPHDTANNRNQKR